MEHDLEQKAQKLADAEEENEILILQVHQMQAELEHYCRINQRLESELRAAEGAASAMKDSWSWRITAPIRRLLRLLKPGS